MRANPAPGNLIEDWTAGIRKDSNVDAGHAPASTSETRW